MLSKKRGRLARRILLSTIDSFLYFHTRIKKSNDPDYIFAKTWTFISNSHLIDHLLPWINRWVYRTYQLQTSEYLLFELVERMKKRGIDYAPNIHLEDKALLIKFSAPDEGAIIVSVHTGFAFNLRILSDLGRKVSVISSDPSITETLARSGIRKPVAIIKNDRYCLAFLKESIMEGSVACCAIDFKQDTKKFEYVSPTLFEFSNRLDIPIYFSKSFVLSDGSLSVRLLRVSGNSTAVECAQEFINFINESSHPKRILSIRADNRKA